MGNRCPDCNKFVSLEIGEQEVSNIDVSESDATLEATVMLQCIECGGDMKQWNINITTDLPEEAAAHQVDHPDHELEVKADGEGEVSDSYRPRKAPKPRKDGSIPKVPMRYQTHFYSFSAEATVKCSCGEEFDNISFSDEIEASGMDELN